MFNNGLQIIKGRIMDLFARLIQKFMKILIHSIILSHNGTIKECLAFFRSNMDQTVATQTHQTDNIDLIYSKSSV